MSIASIISAESVAFLPVVGVLLDRGDRILEQHAFPCREFRVCEIAVDTLDRRRAVVGDFVEYVLDFPVRDVVGVDQHREFFIG